MASKSKKILELINLQSVSPADFRTNENVAINQDGYTQSSNQEEPMNQNTAVNVMVLSDVTNRPENKSYANVNTFFENDKLSSQICGGRKRDYVNYKVSPVNSDESDADVSD